MSTPTERAAEADYLGRCGWTDDAKALWAAHPQVHESWRDRIRPILSAALTDPDDPDALAKVIDDAALMRTGRSIGLIASVGVAAAVRAWLIGPTS